MISAMPYRGCGKMESDGMKKIEISWLRRQGYLSGVRTGQIFWTYKMSGHQNSVGIDVLTVGDEPHIRLVYTATKNDGTKEKHDYKIPLTTTPCNFGGKRYWYICSLRRNGIYCGRRVGVLYGGEYFGCRYCHDLTYSSRNESRTSRTNPLYRSMKILQQIDDLNASMSTPFYAGKPTKKQRRVWRLKQRLGGCAGLLNEK
jgi:hypothetical protein